MAVHAMEETFRFIDRLYEGRHGERLTRDEVVGRAEQAGLEHGAVNLFGHLPPGPYSKEELRAYASDRLEREP